MFMLLFHVALAFTNLFYLIKLGYNADKLPLGKLSKSTILKVSYIEISIWELSIHYGHIIAS